MPTNGRRLVFYPGGRVALEAATLPGPGPRQLLLGVTRSQISAGSEMNAYRTLLAAPPDLAASGRTSGYTTVGRVLAVGPGVEGFRPGDRALAYGNHASHVLVDMADGESWRWYPDLLPDTVTDEQACYAVLGDVALHGVRRAGLQIDESVAVFGVGVVGQLTVQLARLSGAHPIVAADLVPRRLELARRGGATHVVDASAGDPVPAVLEATRGGAQTVFHCSPVAQLLQTAMRAAAPRGKVVLTGSAPGTAEIGLQVELLRHELSILGVYEAGLQAPHPYWPWTRQRNRAACYRLIAGGQLQVDPLTSHVVPPGRAEEMYRMLAAGGDGWMSVYFAWDTA
jgi:2-desacetyl-2-hydroxyethyl bacteriochlorophyllide A dehydrogenase